MKSKTLKTVGLLNPDKLRSFLLTHLDKIFCAKTHLHERLPELTDQVSFKDLKHAINETWEDIGKQIARMDEIYILLDAEPSLANAEELIAYIESDFDPIYQKSSEPELRDLSILFYMSVIESIESASFQLLQMAANRMPDKQIRQLLQGNFDESKADRTLFVQIAAKFTS